MDSKTNKGFTLIELLIVIAIIGVLSSIVMASMNNARTASRDAKRKADLRNLAVGLELYYSKYGIYPCGDSVGPNRMVDSSGSAPFLDGEKPASPLSECSNPERGLYTEGIISSDWLKDPLNQNFYHYSYEVSLDRAEYLLYARLERGANAAANDGGICTNLYEIGTALGKWSELDIVEGGWYGVTCN